MRILLWCRAGLSSRFGEKIGEEIISTFHQRQNQTITWNPCWILLLLYFSTVKRESHPWLRVTQFNSNHIYLTSKIHERKTYLCQKSIVVTGFIGTSKPASFELYCDLRKFQTISDSVDRKHVKELFNEWREKLSCLFHDLFIPFALIFSITTYAA